MKLLLAVVAAALGAAADAPPSPPGSLDEARVKAFLDGARGTWRDLNVPYEDGQVLHRLVVEGKHRHILEIGTSTGHSTVWLAWAAARTGGKVTTLEIDERRHQIALDNIAKAGLGPWVDARLGNAHDLVKSLPGPFDFVFSDADKDWYLQYFLDLDPKIPVGGCFTAHNVLRPMAPQVTEMITAIQGKANYRTHIDRTSSEGILVGCKTAK
jgi:predicted O-methyltransferase YrrM